MLPTSAGVEPATSWSPVGRRIQLSHRGQVRIDDDVIEFQEDDEINFKEDDELEVQD